MSKGLSSHSILVVEDDTFLRKDIVGFLSGEGADCFEAGSLQEARNCLGAETFDFVLMDVNLPDGISLDLLKAKEVPEDSIVVIMTAEGGVRSAVEAMRAGAADYLSKPFDPEELPLVFQRCARERRLSRVREHEQNVDDETAPRLFFGTGMAEVETQLDRILAADRRLGQHLPPVLIEGETGTGKSTLARLLHARGPRSGAALVELNCATIAENIAESELFGHEKGAFTDAHARRLGLFEAAQGGTLFLDEIGSLSPAIQAKLLTAIEDQRIRRVGGQKPIPVDVRLVAASLRPLEEEVGAGRFRQDLYQRLNLVRLQLPPLRERRGDIPGLVEEILGQLKKRYRLPNVTVSEDGMRRLQSHAWPGNVRELRHELERALIFQPDAPLEFGHLGSGAGSEASGSVPLLNPAWDLPAKDQSFDFEKELSRLSDKVIRRALDHSGGNVSAAARLLGVPRDFVRYRIQ